ncbi:DUF4145 domain-containing protein [Alteribacter keqinensis]|nr:DUF4145 domain-containing protein [Alteribacter keqinensis]
MSENLFSFMKDEHKELSELGNYIDTRLFFEPESILIKARVYTEVLAKITMAKEGIPEVYDLKHYQRIQKLDGAGIFTKDILERFEWIRKRGNKAAHNAGCGTFEDALNAHRLIFDLSVWFKEVYDLDFNPPKYRIPQPAIGGSPINTKELNSIISQSVESTIKKSFEDKLKLIEEALHLIKTETASATEPLIREEFKLITHLEKSGYEVIDNREKGGTVWVIGGWELEDHFFSLEERGIYFRYLENGGRASKGIPAWYLRNKDYLD